MLGLESAKTIMRSPTEIKPPNSPAVRARRASNETRVEEVKTVGIRVDFRGEDLKEETLENQSTKQLAVPGCCYDGQLQYQVWGALTSWTRPGKLHIVAGEKTSVTDKPAPLAEKARQGVKHRGEQLDNARTMLGLQKKLINVDHSGLHVFQHHRTKRQISQKKWLLLSHAS